MHRKYGTTAGEVPAPQRDVDLEVLLNRALSFGNEPLEEVPPPMSGDIAAEPPLVGGVAAEPAAEPSDKVWRRLEALETAMRTSVAPLQNEVKTLQGEVAALRGKVAALQDEVAALQAQCDPLGLILDARPL